MINVIRSESFSAVLASIGLAFAIMVYDEAILAVFVGFDVLQALDLPFLIVRVAVLVVVGLITIANVFALGRQLMKNRLRTEHTA